MWGIEDRVRSMISWDRVREFRREVGQDDFAEVAEMFMEEVEGVIQRMRTQPDKASLVEDLHFLKGCALNLGFNAFSSLCEDCERMAASDRSHHINLQDVFSAYEQSKSEFLDGQSALTA